MVDSFIDFIYQPIFDENGQVLGIVSQGSNVTEQVLNARSLGEKQAELERTVAERTRALDDARQALALAHELQLSNNFFQSLFEQAPGFIRVLKGPDHVFDLANEAYRKLVGHRDLFGKAAWDALPEVAAQGFFELHDEVYRTSKLVLGRGGQLELQETVSTSVTRFVDFVYQPILDAQGQSVGIFVQGSDVTKQKIA